MTNLEKIRRKLQLSITPAEALASQIINSGIQFDHAVTLTFPNEPFDHIQAERYFGIFMQYLNERCFRRGFRSGKNRVKVFAIQEGFQYKRNHYHCAVQRPLHLSEDEFKKRIKKCWIKATKDCHAIVDIGEYYSSGWLEYIMKEIGHRDTTGISEHCYW